MASKLAVIVAILIVAALADDSLKAEDDHHSDDHHTNDHHAEHRLYFGPKKDEHDDYNSGSESKDTKHVYGSISLTPPNSNLRAVKFSAAHYGFHPDPDYKGHDQYDEYDIYDRKKGDHGHDYSHDYHQGLELISEHGY